MAAIRHIKKRHGDAAKEAESGQIAITDDGIRALPGIVANPGRVAFGFRTQQGLDAIVLQKQMQDGTVAYVEEVRSGNEELAARTMWKVAATTDAKNVLAHISSGLSVRNDGGVRQSVVEAPQEYNQCVARFSRAAPGPTGRNPLGLEGGNAGDILPAGLDCWHGLLAGMLAL